MTRNITALFDHVKLVSTSSRVISSQTVRALQTCGSFLRDCDLSSLSDIEVQRLTDSFRGLSVCGYSDVETSFTCGSSAEKSESVLESDSASTFGIPVSNRMSRVRAESLRCLLHIFRQKPDSVKEHWSALFFDVPGRPGLLSLTISDSCHFVRRFALHASVALVKGKSWKFGDSDFPAESDTRGYLTERAMMGGVVRGVLEGVCKISQNSEDKSSVLAVLPDLAASVPWRRFSDGHCMALTLIGVALELAPQIAHESINSVDLRCVFSSLAALLPFAQGIEKKFPGRLQALFLGSPGSAPFCEALSAAIGKEDFFRVFAESGDFQKILEIVRKFLLPGSAVIAGVICAGRLGSSFAEWGNQNKSNQSVLELYCQDLFKLADAVEDGPLLGAIVESIGSIIRGMRRSDIIACDCETKLQSLIGRASELGPKMRVSVCKCLGEVFTVGLLSLSLLNDYFDDPVPEVVGAALRAIIVSLSRKDRAIDRSIGLSEAPPGFELALLPQDICRKVLSLAEYNSDPRWERVRADAVRCIGWLGVEDFNVEIIASAFDSKFSGTMNAAFFVLERNFQVSKNEKIREILRKFVDGKYSQKARLYLEN